MGRDRLRPPAPLAVLLAVALVLSVCWTIVMPPFTGPDEQQHFAYTQKLVESGEIPWTALGYPMLGPETAYSRELDEVLTTGAVAPAQANPAGRPARTVADERIFERNWRPLGDDDRSNGGFVPAMKNPPLYYLYAAVPYALTSSASPFDRELLMRLANLPMLAVVVVMTWLLAGELLGGRRWLQAVATAAVALQPQLTSVSATVNPDLMLAAIVSAALYAMVILVRRGWRTSLVAGVVGLSAAAALTHGRGAPLVAAAAAAIAFAAWRRWTPRRRAVRRGVVAAAVGLGVVALAAVVAYASLWEPSLSRTRQFGSYLWQFYLPRLPFMDPPLSEWDVRNAFVERLFSGLVLLDVNVSPGLLRMIKYVVLIVGVGAVVGLVRARAAVARSWPVVAVLALAAAAYLLGLHATGFRSLLRYPDPVITGRYLLPLMPLIGCGVAAAVAWLPRYVRAVAGTAVVAALALLQLEAMGLMLERFYA